MLLWFVGDMRLDIGVCAKVTRVGKSCIDVSLPLKKLKTLVKTRYTSKEVKFEV